MNIQVRVLSAAARGQLKALQAQMAGLNATTRAGSAAQLGFTGGLARGFQTMRKWGSQTQWAGRQLQRNFTIPLLLAAGAAVKFSLDNEKAFTRIQKVYGDTADAIHFFRRNQDEIPDGMNAATAAAATMRNELEALGDAFEAISEHYGVNQKEVLETASAWAAAGVSGVDLAKAVDLTMQAVMLGDMDAAKATQALISIQAQYNLSNKELILTLQELNAVENQTGISLPGLIDGFQRAAGVARSAGINTRELAAELAALVPAAGTAAQAGNALKTIYSRLLAPTGDTQDILKALNIDLRDNAWLNATVADRLKIVSARFNELSDTQRAVAASVIGSRWQLNKLVILLDEMSKKNGFYQKALNATANRQKVFQQATKELNAILDSSPNKFQRIWVAIQNGMANAIGPLIPYILYLFNTIRMGIEWFQKLDPRWQKFILYVGMAVAVLPILIIYLGSLFVLFGTLGTILLDVGAAFLTVAGAILSPWGLAIAGIVALFVFFKDEVANIWNNIVEYFSDTNNAMVKAVLSAWYALPQGVANALTQVAQIVHDAAMYIYEMFSYINPWAHHSPSLVENVTTGIAEVNRQFGKLSVGGAIKQAYAEIKNFGKLTRQLGVSADAMERKEDRKTLAKVSPEALASYDRLVKLLNILTPKLRAAEAAMAAQQRVVDEWQRKLDVLNNKLDVQKDKLQKLQDVADKWADKLQAAQDQLDYFANAPIEGMKAMNDAIFENDMATKRLQLQMMQYEDVNGTLDDMKNKMDAIAGAQELLRGEQASLRSAGAGSDVLQGYQDQIDALDEQKKALDDATKPLQDMNDELEKLQRKGQELDLLNSLQFDPLKKQIDEAAHSMQELPFDEIMAGIQAAQADISKYTDKWNEANAAVQQQQAVVDQLEKQRDRIGDRLDKEQAKLDKLRNAYDRINDAVQAINQSLQDVLSNADKLSSKKGGGKDISPALQAFNDAKGGNFPDVGGTGSQIRKNWEDQSKQIEQFTQDLQDKTAKMFAKLNPFGPIKEKWGEFKKWFSAEWAATKQGFKDFFIGLLGGPDAINSAKQKITAVFQTIGDFLTWVKEKAAAAWELFGPSVIKTLKRVGVFFKRLWKEVGPEVIDLIKAIGSILGIVWKILKPVVGLIILALSGVIKVAWSMLNSALKPVFSGVVNLIKGLIQIVTGVLDVIVFLFTGKWSAAWEAVKKIVSGIGNVILGLIQGVFGGIIGLVVGFVTGFVDWFYWLWDKLVGHSIVPDIVNGIFFWFKLLIKLPVWLWNNVIKPVWDGFKKVWDNYIKPFLSTLWSGIKAILKPLWELAKWVWENVLRPLWEKFKDGFGKVKEIVSDAKDKINDKFQSIKDKVGDVLQFIKELPGNIKDLGSKMFDAGKTLFEKFIDGIKSAAGTIADMAGVIWGKLKDIINDFAIQPLRNALNFTIDPPGPLGPWHFNIGDKIPYLYTGGIVKGSRAGTLAVLGDRGHDEAVVPLSGPHSPFRQGGSMDWRSGSIGSSGRYLVININGNLEFPNITSGDDAEDFITNLEILAGAA